MKISPSGSFQVEMIILGPPVVPFYQLFGVLGSPTKIDRKSWYPYSNLSTGGPSKDPLQLGPPYSG